MFERSVIVRSGQMWKLALGAFVLAVAGIAMVVSRINADRPESIWLMIGSTAAALAGLAGWCLVADVRVAGRPGCGWP